MASYPTSVKSFTTKNTADTIQGAHVNDLQSEVTAIETDLIAGLPVTRGGTGATSLTANGVLVGNGPGAVVVTAAGASGQVLTVNASGVPVFDDAGGDSESAVLAASIFG